MRQLNALREKIVSYLEKRLDKKAMVNFKSFNVIDWTANN